MLIVNVYIIVIYDVITVDYCKCILLYSPLNSHLYVHWILLLNIIIIRTRASLDPCLLCVPPISKTCANSFFDISFVYAAPTLWNALDLDIRLLPFDALKKRVNPFATRSRSQRLGCSRHGTRSRCEQLANLSQTILIIYQIKT